MSLFRGIQEYIALDANNIALVFDSGNIVSISGNIFLYPPQGHPILYKYAIHSLDHSFRDGQYALNHCLTNRQPNDSTSPLHRNNISTVLKILYWLGNICNLKKPVI